MDYTFLNIVSGASTTTTVKSGGGLLRGIMINTPVASGTLTVYNSTTASGTKVATITLPVAVGAPQFVICDCNVNVGITVLSTVAGLDFTVIYK